jgi:stage IV sporulation protein FB
VASAGNLRGKLSLSPGAAVLLAALLYFGEEETLLAYGLAALLHEGAHGLAAWCCGLTLERLDITPSGGAMCLAGACPPWQEGVILLAGPVCNLLQGWVCVKLGWFHGAGAALVLGVLNLLPVAPLDGGQLLRLMFTSLWGNHAGERASGGVSFLTLFGLLAAGSWLVQSANGTPALLLFALWLLFFTISSFFPCQLFRRQVK